MSAVDRRLEPPPGSPGFAVLFDLNGTLVDDAACTYEAWRQVCLGVGRRLSREEFDLHVAGLGAGKSVAYLFGTSIPTERIREYATEKQRIYLETVDPAAAEVPGLRALLRDLVKHRAPLALVTSARPGTIDFLIDGLCLRQAF